MPTPNNAYRFYHSAVEGLNLATEGLVYEYNSTDVEYLTGIGLVTEGLVYGTGDFWQYADDAQTITWTFVS